MASTDKDFYYGTFPKDFKWSTATASYQIEGAWKEDDRGLSIWDTFSHNLGNVDQGDTGDVACDSYHKYKEDIKLIKSLGIQQYRFSIAWPRILPDGTKKSFNQKGVDYYNRLIDGLLAEGVEPMVTLYHWDLPQTLQDRGGWTNPDMVQYFVDYAEVCFKAFGDRVKLWLTFNEPSVFVYLGYGNGEHAPGYKDPLRATFHAGHTVIQAHVKTYRMYQDKFKSTQKGQVGITLNMDWNEPKDPSKPADVTSAELIMQSRLGWWAEPIFGSGDYPEVMKKQLAAKAQQLGLPDTPLPTFSPEEVKNNKGTSDFFGLNMYTSRLISHCPTHDKSLSMEYTFDVNVDVDPSWKRGKSEWLYVVPWGMRKLLKWIKTAYNNPAVYITESGYSDDGQLDDTDRIDCVRDTVNNVLKAIRLDGCDVRAYTLWSLVDNFEWAKGYSEKFGIHHVDFNDPERKRTPKASAKFYAKLVKDNGFPKPN